MIKRFFLFTFIIFLPLIIQAGYGKGNHVVSVSAGGVVGADDLGHVMGSGLGGGAAYRYYVADSFSLGVDTALDNYGDHFSDEDQTDVGVRLFSTSLLGRVDFMPKNDYATYFSLGYGGNYIEEKFHEPTGDRTEKAGRSGYFLALGFEAPMKGRWMWGAELRSIDPLGVSVNALGLKLTLSRRFGKEAAPTDNLIH